MPCPVCWQQATVFDKQGCGICRTLFVGKTFQISVYRSVRYSFVGRGHDPADHLNNYEMFVFCAILAVCKSLFRSKNPTGSAES
jgi:hypothetical protein